MTSNVATDEIVQFTKDPDLAPPYEDLVGEIKPAMLKVFPPALLGRIVTIPYLPFADEVLRDIVSLKLDKVARRMDTERGIRLDYDDTVVSFVHERCQDAGSGARMIDAILTNTLLPEISRRLLERMLTEESTSAVAVTVKDDALDAAFS
jgi:type VI secretion system protein VasG